jgi:hypothetical protein
MTTLASLSGDETMVLMTLIIMLSSVLIIWGVAYNWRKLRVAAYNARLKQLMIERDMSADEIERVLRADGRLEQTQPPAHRWRTRSEPVVD